MSIINTNVVTLADSDLTLDTTVISVHTSTINNNSLDTVKVMAQIGFFLNADKMLESPTNALKVVGFENKNKLIFDYPVSDTNVFYFFDLELKKYLMSLFPAWDEAKLTLTTAP